MGRLLLLLVAASAIATTTAAVNRHHAREHVRGHYAASEQGTLARQAALSGFAVADRGVRADFGGRSSRAGVALGGGQFGTYDATVRGASDGTRVSVVGHYGRAAHQVEALFRETVAFPAAVVAHADAFDVALGADAVIDGRAHRPPSVAADGWTGAGRTSVAGVAAQSTSVEDAFRAGAGPDAERVGGAPAFTTRPTPAWLDALVAEAEAHPEAQHVGSLRLDGRQIGTPTAPAVVVASAGAALTGGARGYGVLVVRGPFEMEDSEWEGLIVVEAAAGTEERVALDDAAVYGALLLYGTDRPAPPGGTLDDGDFDLDVFRPRAKSNNGHGNNCDGVDSSNPGKGKGGPTGKKNRGEDPSDGVDDECKGGKGKQQIQRVYHKDRYSRAYGAAGLDFLAGPDLRSEFASLVADYGHRNVRVEFANASNGSGTYRIAGHEGSVRDGFSRTLRLADVAEFRVDFASARELRGTAARAVDRDEAGRDRAFTVRFYDGATLLFEASAYERTAVARDGAAGGAAGGARGSFRLRMDDGGVWWSPQAVTRLRQTLRTLDGAVVIERALLGDAPAR